MTVIAIERCLSLLEELAGEAEPLELTELAARAGLPRSATHRILSTLQERGWVIQDELSQKYALSLRLSTLAFRNLDARAVPDIVQSVLDDLAAKTREYCRLAIDEGDDLIWVARAQGATSGLRYDPDMGQEIVLHATANGKAWLATLPQSEAIRIVSARGFDTVRPLGPNAITSVEALRENLAETKSRGYSVAYNEGEEGTVALAVPFRASQARFAPVAGTISVAGPILRIGPERYEALGSALRASAEEIAAVWPLRIRQRQNNSSSAKLGLQVVQA